YANAGTYPVTVLARETANHLSASVEVTLVIGKTDVDGISFESGEFSYDGRPHSLSVEGLPAGATVSYEGNGQVDAGTYTVTAKVQRENHHDLELKATLTIHKAEPVITAAALQTHVYDG